MNIDKNKLRGQAIALAGVFQAASLVEQIAKQGQPSQDSYQTMIDSVLNQNPDSVEDVYANDLSKLHIGLQELKAILSSDKDRLNQDVVRYALSILHLATLVGKMKNTLSDLGEGINNAARQKDHFGLTHENVIRNLGGLYQDTLSKFKFRIHVTGNPTYLRDDFNGAKIRSLLLAGVRSAILWRQLGGRRWKLIFQKKKLLAETNNLMHEINS